MADPQIAERLVARVEKVMQKRREGSEALREAWERDALTKPDLPCYDRCDGNIVVPVDGQKVQGFCPVYMTEPFCPLVTIHAREMQARMERSGFGSQYQHPNPERIRVLEAVSEYLAHLRVNIQTGRGLILSGDVGVGKTMTLGYMARQMLEEGIGVWKVHMPQLVEDLADRDRRRAVVERAIRVQVFMLDDFGSGDMPTWVLGILEGIVEHRYSNQRPTIVTTNLDRQVLVKAPEFRRIVDRWREKNRWVGIGGTSQRHGSE